MGGDPLNYVDPWGKDRVKAVGAGAAGGAGKGAEADKKQTASSWSAPEIDYGPEWGSASESDPMPSPEQSAKTAEPERSKGRVGKLPNVRLGRMNLLGSPDPKEKDVAAALTAKEPHNPEIGPKVSKAWTNCKNSANAKCVDWCTYVASGNLTDSSCAPKGPYTDVNKAYGGASQTILDDLLGGESGFNSRVNRIKGVTDITDANIETVRGYLEGRDIAGEPENVQMLDRLTRIAAGEATAEAVDINFLQHELLEGELVGTGVSTDYEDVGASRPGEVWAPAHDITRTALGVDNVYP